MSTRRLPWRVNDEVLAILVNDCVRSGTAGESSSALARDAAVGAMNEDLLDDLPSDNMGVVLCGLSGNDGVELRLLSFVKGVTLRLPSVLRAGVLPIEVRPDEALTDWVRENPLLF